jgi:hypothetical protein
VLEQACVQQIPLYRRGAYLQDIILPEVAESFGREVGQTWCTIDDICVPGGEIAALVGLPAAQEDDS